MLAYPTKKNINSEVRFIISSKKYVRVMVLYVPSNYYSSAGVIDDTQYEFCLIGTLFW